VAAKKRGSGKSGTVGPHTHTSPEGFREPFNIDSVPWKPLAGRTSFKQLGAYGGGAQVGVGIDILKDSATLILGSRKYVMKERDYCCFPAGQRAGHHLLNHTKQNCVFMTIGDNDPDDIAVFPNSGKARVRATGKVVPIAEL
jgi:hypothetical protein